MDAYGENPHAPVAMHSCSRARCLSRAVHLLLDAAALRAWDSACFHRVLMRHMMGECMALVLTSSVGYLMVASAGLWLL